MAPGGETYRLYERFGENVLRHGSHEWLPYSKNAVCTKSSNTNFPGRFCFHPVWEYHNCQLSILNCQFQPERISSTMHLILASGSPRRRELLGLFGIPFVIRAADIDETMNPDLPAQDEVARVSRLKALAVPREAGDVVIAADTIVVCGGKILGKPHSPEEAENMLRLLSGREHQVMTGCTVCAPGGTETFTEITELHFRQLSDREIRRYVASGEPMDKAGSYGIQGGAALFCEGLRGDYYNVMGLPVCRLGQVLAKVAPQLMEDTQ